MKAVHKYVKGLLLVLTLGLCSQGFSEQISKIPYDNSPAMDHDYLSTEEVHVTPEGIFIVFDGQVVQVNALCSDEKGVFVPGFELTRQFVWCPFCQHWYDPEKPHTCS